MSIWNFLKTKKVAEVPCPDAVPAPSKRFGELRGAQSVVIAFCRRPNEADFTEAEKKRMLKKVEEATRWISERAEAWSVPVAFGRPVVLGKTAVFEYPKSFKENNSGLWRGVLSALHWGSPGLVHDSVRRQQQSEHAVGLILARGPGRSFAMPQRDQPLPAALIYNREPTRVFAHELLHLYGADDLYAEGSFQQQAKTAKRLYSEREIMLSLEDLKECEIGPFTAFLLGWHAKENPEQRNQWPSHFARLRRH